MREYTGLEGWQEDGCREERSGERNCDGREARMEKMAVSYALIWEKVKTPKNRYH